MNNLQTERLSPWFIAVTVGVTGCWLALIVMLASRGVFQAQPPALPLALLVAIVVPPTAFALLLKFSATVHRQILAINPVWLCAVQGLRILGVGFLFVYAFGHLPGVFAHMAGWGDLLVAVLAPFAAAHLAKHPEFLKSAWLWRFHALGMLDFVGAVGSGLMARGLFTGVVAVPDTAPLAELPLALIPGFAVPLWICLHIAAFTQIQKARAEARAFEV